MSQPRDLSSRATSTASAGSSPPGTQSTALMRTLIGRSAGHTWRHASKISSGNRMRLASDATVFVLSVVGQRAR